MPFMDWINPGQAGQRSAQSREIEKYTLVGNGGWLVWCKLLVGSLLAGWNAHLFVETIRGRMGVFTACVAVCLEITALYCVHNYTRSIGDHKKWLGRFAVILGVFSLAHAVFAIVDYTGYAGNSPYISFYSHVLALPIIVVLLSVTTATLSMKHWSAEVMFELAVAKVESLKNRSRVLTERHRLLDAHELTLLKADLFDKETELKLALIPTLARRIEAGEQMEQMLSQIADEELRRQIRRDLAEVTSRLSATSTPASVMATEPATAGPPRSSPHARQSVLGRELAKNGGRRNGHF
jgi:hypothetical protein